LNDVFPLTRYPNATGAETGEAIQLAAGERREIDFALHAVAPVHVSVQTPAAAPGHRGSIRWEDLLFGKAIEDRRRSFDCEDPLDDDAGSGGTATWHCHLAPGQYDLIYQVDRAMSHLRVTLRPSDDGLVIPVTPPTSGTQ
jgi:hypothetical protein